MAASPVKFTVLEIDKAQNTIKAVAEVASKKIAAETCARYPDRTSDLLAAWHGEPILEEGSDRLVGVSLERGTESHLVVTIRPHDKRMTTSARIGDTFTLDGVAE